VAARPAIGCEHRTVSKDGRILCKKIVEGENEVSPNVCRDCPMRAVNCEHLRFSLRLSSPTPLTVRFNGRTEIWDDGPPALAFERAACAARVVPIRDARACAGCTLRKEHLPARSEPVEHPARVVAFPGREAVAAAD
jgi:hypothetical protein